MKRKLTKSLVTSVCSSVCLLGASAGIVFGISAGMYKLQYMKLGDNDGQARAEAAVKTNYYNQDIISKWNMIEKLNPKSSAITTENWKNLHGDVPLPNMLKDGSRAFDFGSGDISESNMKERWKYVSMCIDGSTHSTLDRSFNESLYHGIVNFIYNKEVPGKDLKSESTVMPADIKNAYSAASFRPAEDNNNGLTSTYKAIADDANSFRVLGLAGFNHVSPLGDLGTVNDHGLFVFNSQYTNLAKMNMLLIDGNVPNNQNISSVLFRSDQPGFLTGISTCMYFMNNLKTYHAGYRDLSIAAYGGNPIPTVVIYMGGVQRGIEFFNRFVLERGILGTDGVKVLNDKESISNYKDFKQLCDYSKDNAAIYDFIRGSTTGKFKTTEEVLAALYNEYQVKMIKLGAFTTHFTGSFASGDAIGITKQYLARGASAIIAVAGPQSLDSAQEIQNQGSNCIVIGVDTAMEKSQYQRTFGRKGFEDTTTAGDDTHPSQSNNIIKFSAVKDMTTVTKKFCDLCAQNKFFDVESSTEPGQPDPLNAVCGVGYQTCGNILNGLISISFDGWHPLCQALRHVGSLDGTDTFKNIWAAAAAEYVKRSDVSIPEWVKSKIVDLDFIDTYNEDKVFDAAHPEDTVGKYYSHITSILGLSLATKFKLNFENMSVDLVKDESGNIISATPHQGPNSMSVLDWLKQNMYFTC